MMQKRFILNIILIFSFLNIGSAQLKNQNIQAEKVHLSTDKPYYVVGEDLYLSAFLVNYETYKLSTNSEVLHLALLNSKNDELIKQSIILKNGRGAGQFYLDRNLPTGVYSIIAYTNWMLNAIGQSYSLKKIWIFNPDKDSPSLDVVDRVSVDFFPEGGEIVNNHMNRIGFIVKDKEIEYDGVVINSAADTVALVPKTSLGYGNFTFFPTDTSSYKLLLKNNDLVESYPLPEGNSDKLSVRLLNVDTDTLNLLINLGSKYSGKILNVLVQNKGQIVLGAQQPVYGSRVKFVFPRSSLQTGLNQLVVYDDRDKILVERLFYISPKNNDLCDFEIKKTQYFANEDINVPISFKCSDKNTFLNASVSIKNLKYYPIANVDRIDFWLEIFSEINYYPTSNEILRKLQDPTFMDLFLITQKINTFNIGDILAGKQTYLKYAAQKTNSIVLSGKVLNSTTNQPYALDTLFCTILSNNPKLYAVQTDQNGNFAMNVEPFYGESILLLKLKGVDENKNEVEYQLDQYKPKLSNSNNHHIPKPTAEQLSELYTFVKEDRMIQRFYYPNELKQKINASELEAYGFFNKYNFSRDFTEYQVMKNFNELVKELIPVATTKKENGQDKVFLKKYDKTDYNKIDDTFNDPMKGSPLIIIDGLPITDQNRLFQLKPRNIKRIQTVNTEVFINFLYFDGILEVETIEDNYYNDHNSNHGVYKVEGFTKELSSIENDGLMQSEDSKSLGKVPDFRSLMYWNPSLKLKAGEIKNLKFTSSDDIGDFLLEIQGIDNHGKIYYYQKIISFGKKN